MATPLHFKTRGHLPVIHQTEAAECGLASVGMVAWFHGHRIDLAGMRRRFTVSLWRGIAWVLLHGRRVLRSLLGRLRALRGASAGAGIGLARCRALALPSAICGTLGARHRENPSKR